MRAHSPPRRSAASGSIDRVSIFSWLPARVILGFAVLIAPAAAQVTVTGPCVLTSSTCATSSGYPTSNYGSTESCLFSNVPPLPLWVESFNVESSSTCGFDALTVASQKYCGTDGPSGVVPTDGTIAWSSDGSITTSGWKICWSGPPQPSPSPLSPPPPPAVTCECDTIT
eukprot:scaffold19077_cov184-Isochrysis_galbana.AAC.1